MNVGTARPRVVPAAQQRVAHELVERHHDRDRVAGKAEEVRAADAAVGERPPGFHRDLPEQHFAELVEQLLDEIGLADGDAAAGDHDVGAARPLSRTRARAHRDRRAPRPCRALRRPSRVEHRRRSCSGCCRRSRLRASGVPMETSSSPVEKKATRSLRKTLTSLMPSEASMPDFGGRASAGRAEHDLPALDVLAGEAPVLSRLGDRPRLDRDTPSGARLHAPASRPCPRPAASTPPVKMRTACAVTDAFRRTAVPANDVADARELVSPLAQGPRSARPNRPSLSCRGPARRRRDQVLGEHAAERLRARARARSRSPVSGTGDQLARRSTGIEFGS